MSERPYHGATSRSQRVSVYRNGNEVTIIYDPHTFHSTRLFITTSISKQ